MSYKDFLLSVLILACACVYVARSLDYSDLEGVGVACPDRDSCAAYNRRANFSRRNCECDGMCARFGDCCINANVATSSRVNRNSQRNHVCLRFGEHLHTGVYAINTCKPNWSGPEQVRQKCRGPGDLSDPLNAAPVINTRLGITYKNRYCAECNDASASNLTSFQILVNCDDIVQPNSTEYVWNNIDYDSDSGKWGMNRWNANMGRAEFLACELLFNLPDYAGNRGRLCRAGLLSSCPAHWTRHQVRRNCEAYMAVVYGNDNRVYRNPHCALCHNVTVDNMKCDPGISGRVKPPLSFALLLDVNRSDGDQVGMSRQATPSCASGQKYDPFFKKCRTLSCVLPGYEMRNGRCVRAMTSGLVHFAKLLRDEESCFPPADTAYEGVLMDSDLNSKESSSPIPLFWEEWQS